ncbi:MAG: hypothetical protein ACOYIK_05745 [Coriobacteriales bacterium]|jgi:hypothetical protein
MTRDEFLALDPAEMAKILNEGLAAGKSRDEVEGEFGLTKAELVKQNLFFVKDKYMARAWSGYTSTKRTGNEAGDTNIGVGDSDPSQGYKGI